MNKVRKKDLEDLIISFYCVFIADILEDEYVDLSYDKKVNINVKPTHIEAWWNFVGDSDSKLETEHSVKEFSEELEKVTFGNLEVTCCIYIKEHIVKIYIANAYEVIE